MAKQALFPGMQPGGELVCDLRRMNPWWEGNPLPVLPGHRRLLVQTIRSRLNRSPAPIIVVRGPRQIGKTTAQLHLIESFLREGVDPKRIFRVRYDDLPSLSDYAEPILRLVDWYEDAVLGRTPNDAARAGSPAYLFFDEVQNLEDRAPQLKSPVDSVTAQVVATGSSALRIEKQGRDSLAGRINTVEVGVLSPTEIEPPEIRLKRKRGFPKICPADHGLRAARLREVVPLDPDGLDREPHLADLAGHIAESVVGSTLSSVSGPGVAGVPQRHDQPEIDFVPTVGTYRIPPEVKYRRRIDPLRDTEAMRTFIETAVNGAPFGTLVTLSDVEPMDDPRIAAMPLSTLMMIR